MSITKNTQANDIHNLQKKSENQEREERREVTSHFQCTWFCRCCPFPGAKCCDEEHPAH